jgi:hypothetical protein
MSRRQQWSQYWRRYQCSQYFLLFRENLKINVVMNAGKTKYQCGHHFCTENSNSSKIETLAYSRVGCPKFERS